jgi:hypothetical protein
MKPSTTTTFPDEALIAEIRADARGAQRLEQFDLASWLVMVGIRASLSGEEGSVTARLVSLVPGNDIAWRNPVGGFHNPSFTAPTAAAALGLLADSARSTDIYLCGRRSVLLRKGYYRA